MDIKDSVALITGAGSGIGEAIAKDLAQRGSKIILVDRSLEAVQRVANDIQGSGGHAHACAADVTSEDDTSAFIEAGLRQFGKLNIVVTCAGVIRDGLMISPDRETGKVAKKLNLQHWQQVIDVNLTGTFLTLRDCAQAIANGG